MQGVISSAQNLCVMNFNVFILEFLVLFGLHLSVSYMVPVLFRSICPVRATGENLACDFGPFVVWLQNFS